MVPAPIGEDSCRQLTGSLLAVRQPPRQCDPATLLRRNLDPIPITQYRQKSPWHEFAQLIKLTRQPDLFICGLFDIHRNHRTRRNLGRVGETFGNFRNLSHLGRNLFFL